MYCYNYIVLLCSYNGLGLETARVTNLHNDAVKESKWSNLDSLYVLDVKLSGRSWLRSNSKLEALLFA